MNSTSLNFKSKNLNITITSPNNRNKPNISEDLDSLPNVQTFTSKKIRNSCIKINQNNEYKITDAAVNNDYYAKDLSKQCLSSREKDDGQLAYLNFN